MSKVVDISGMRFGMLVVIDRADDTGKRARWNCKCDCGATATRAGSDMKSGNTKSCGCLHRLRFTSMVTKHGESGSREYKRWASMKSRCTNPKNKLFHRYGGRGIKLCDRWLDFPAFHSDMGDAPEGMTIERVDNDAGYSPENCRWATRWEQNRNTSSNVTLSACGLSMIMIEWSETLGVKYTRLVDRRRAGWSDSEVLFGRNLVDKERLLPKIYDALASAGQEAAR